MFHFPLRCLTFHRKRTSSGRLGPGAEQQAAAGPLPHSHAAEPSSSPLELGPAPTPGLPSALSPGWTPQTPAVALSLLLLLTGAQGWTLDLADHLTALGSVNGPHCSQSLWDRTHGRGHGPRQGRSWLHIHDSGIRTRVVQLVSEWRQRRKNNVIW